MIDRHVDLYKRMAQVLAGQAELLEREAAQKRDGAKRYLERAVALETQEEPDDAGPADC